MPARNTSPKTNFKITGDMIIADVIRAFPQTIEIFQQMGIHCVSCYIANFESIEEGISRHGINPIPVIKKLNELINQKNVRRNSPTAKSRTKRNTHLSSSRKP